MSIFSVDFPNSLHKAHPVFRHQYLKALEICDFLLFPVFEVVLHDCAKKGVHTYGNITSYLFQEGIVRAGVRMFY